MESYIDNARKNISKGKFLDAFTQLDHYLVDNSLSNSEIAKDFIQLQRRWNTVNREYRTGQMARPDFRRRESEIASHLLDIIYELERNRTHLVARERNYINQEIYKKENKKPIKSHHYLIIRFIIIILVLSVIWGGFVTIAWFYPVNSSLYISGIFLIFVGLLPTINLYFEFPLRIENEIGPDLLGLNFISTYHHLFLYPIFLGPQSVFSISIVFFDYIKNDVVSEKILFPPLLFCIIGSFLIMIWNVSSENQGLWNLSQKAILDIDKRFLNFYFEPHRFPELKHELRQKVETTVKSVNSWSMSRIISFYSIWVQCFMLGILPVMSILLSIKFFTSDPNDVELFDLMYSDSLFILHATFTANFFFFARVKFLHLHYDLYGGPKVNEFYNYLVMILITNLSVIINLFFILPVVVCILLSLILLSNLIIIFRSQIRKKEQINILEEGLQMLFDRNNSISNYFLIGLLCAFFLVLITTFLNT